MRELCCGRTRMYTSLHLKFPFCGACTRKTVVSYFFVSVCAWKDVPAFAHALCSAHVLREGTGDEHAWTCELLHSSSWAAATISGLWCSQVYRRRDMKALLRFLKYSPVKHFVTISLDFGYFALFSPFFLSFLVSAFPISWFSFCTWGITRCFLGLQCVTGNFSVVSVCLSVNPSLFSLFLLLFLIPWSTL